MQKKYIVRLTDAEQETLKALIKKKGASALKVRRAHMLLKADINGPGWTDVRIAEAFGCTVHAMELLRERFVTDGFESTFNGKPKARARPRILDGEQEAKIIALRLGQPPAGFANWSLRLLTQKVVELGIVESISHETVRRTLKKTR